MCNAFNHEYGCNCGWGAGIERVTWSRSVDQGSHESSLTFKTRCFWCNVGGLYFHRAKNGGCVLLEALGPPWPVHPCWLERGPLDISAARRMLAPASKLDYAGYKIRAFNEKGECPEHIKGFISSHSRAKFRKIVKIGQYKALENLYVMPIVEGLSIFEILFTEKDAKNIESGDIVDCETRTLKTDPFGDKIILASRTKVYRLNESSNKMEIKYQNTQESFRTEHCSRCKSRLERGAVTIGNRINCSSCEEAISKELDLGFYCKHCNVITSHENRKAHLHKRTFRKPMRRVGKAARKPKPKL